jgi:hypothetical protein
MRIGIRQKWRREAIAVENNEVLDCHAELQLRALSEEGA